MENIFKGNIKKNLLIGGGMIVAIIAIIAIIVLAVNISNRPNKEKAKQVVEEYVMAMSDGNSEKMFNAVDLKGYIVFSENKEKAFDENYKKKDEYIKEYLNRTDSIDLNIAKQKISSNFTNLYGYYAYSINEIIDIENSKKSKNLIIVKCKVQLKSNSYTTENSAKFYILKNNNDYKIVGLEM